MDPAVIAAVKEKFMAFDIHNITYQEVNGHAITADILIPKIIKPGKHPVIISFHGGYLVCHPPNSLCRNTQQLTDNCMQITGSSLFPGHFLPWIMDFALENSAVLVRPNYRKLPESTGLEILENLTDFWKWFHGRLRTVVKSATAGKVEADEFRTLVIGHSAGTCIFFDGCILMRSCGHFAEILDGS